MNLISGFCLAIITHLGPLMTGSVEWGRDHVSGKLAPCITLLLLQLSQAVFFVK